MKRSSIWSAKQVCLGVLLVGALATGAHAGSRKFYLTKGLSLGSQALTACAKGYHMASLWEILNVSTLTYDTKLGAVTADSGSGPPVTAGRIRTGFLDEATSTPGEGNCHTWTSDSGTDEGTIVNLAATWQSGASVISPWQASASICSNMLHVWCVAGK